MTAVTLSPSQGKPVSVGVGQSTKVMALIGTNNRASYKRQLEKLDALADMDKRPDLVADLSITRNTPELVPEIVARGFVASALPVYGLDRRSSVIDPGHLLDRCLSLMDLGVGMLTIHPTPSHELIALAQSRHVPWTSRGGGILIKDLLITGGKENAYLRILPELAQAARKHGVALSLGASFRSANILDSLDAAQLSEIASQVTLADELRDSGVMVMLEGPGHASPSSIRRVAEILGATGHPIVPLGPIPTDTAAGQDHISSAIGATLLGLQGAAHLLAAVTREEHTGGVPTLNSTIEAVEAARVAAHVIDLGRLQDQSEDKKVVLARAEAKSCVVDRNKPGCSRCADACPLIIDPRSLWEGTSRRV